MGRLWSTLTVPFSNLQARTVVASKEQIDAKQPRLQPDLAG